MAGARIARGRVGTTSQCIKADVITGPLLERGKNTGRGAALLELQERSAKTNMSL
jgi:hypothetical protein